MELRRPAESSSRCQQALRAGTALRGLLLVAFVLATPSNCTVPSWPETRLDTPLTRKLLKPLPTGHPEGHAEAGPGQHSGAGGWSEPTAGATAAGSERDVELDGVSGGEGGLPPTPGEPQVKPLAALGFEAFAVHLAMGQSPAVALDTLDNRDPSASVDQRSNVARAETSSKLHHPEWSRGRVEAMAMELGVPTPGPWMESAVRSSEDKAAEQSGPASWAGHEAPALVETDADSSYADKETCEEADFAAFDSCSSLDGCRCYHGSCLPLCAMAAQANVPELCGSCKGEICMCAPDGTCRTEFVPSASTRASKLELLWSWAWSWSWKD